MAERIALISAQGHATFESGRLRKDGGVIPIEVRSRLIEMDGEAVLLGISRDISERKRTENTLRENEERLALATLHNGVGIWDWNLATQEMIWDESMYALYRIRREDFSGSEEAWRAALHPDDLERGDREVEAAIRGERPFDTEFRVVWPNGEIRYIKAVAKVFRDEQGTPLRMLGTNVDITDRRQAEERLRQLSAAVEQSAASVVITDLEARIQYVNPRFTEVTGYSADEAVGQNPRILQSGQTPEAVYQELWSKLAGGQEWSGELLNKRKNGELYWEEVSIAPVRNSQGIVTHYVAVKNEITERKRMEAALAASEHRYRMLIENSPFCIHEIDLEGRLQSMNPVGLGMMGLSDEETICGVPYLDSVSEPDNERIGALLREAIDGNSRHFEFAAVGDEPRYFKSCFIPIKDVDSKVIKLMGITEDITRRKRGEDTLREQKEFLASIFENALDAVTMMDAKGVITGWSKQAEQTFGWSHDEVVGRPMHEVIIPERHREHHLLGLSHFLATGEGPALNRRIEISALHRDGHEFPIELSISPIRTGHGYAFSSFIRDITASKRAEELLLKQKQFSDDVINSLPGIFYILDAMGNILRVNPQFQAVSGYSAAELEGASALTLFEGDDRALIEERIREVFATGSAWAEAELVTRSGQKIPYYFSGHLTNIDGRSYVVGLGTDITERKRAELKLQQSEAHFRFISESAQALIWMAGTERFRTWFNKVWLDFTGRTVEQERGGGWTEGVHPDDRQRRLETYAGHFDRREPFTMEYRLRRHDGEYRWIIDSGSPRFSAQGVFEGYIARVSISPTASGARKTCASPPACSTPARKRF
ncbi:PAS domain-containing protein [Methylogaea oryzae]|uniref:PAS domain-containing protein n=1 Tax=Methylogaea oryzae TaxID=1295382 RepID=UPI0006CF6C46|nr:PAS domain S-box protein [Methylogaea oryzae]